jgi:3-(3-hydroxy-phenyl)propionate hydroxylase
MLPIFGVRGANTGWQDGQNLAWKLAATIKQLAGPGLLASYSEERVAAAREIVDEAGKSTRFMTPPTRGFRLLRDAVLSLSLSQDFVRPLFHWRTSRPHDYAGSSLSAMNDDDALFGAGPSVGAAMANVKLGVDDYLMDERRPGFVLLSFGDAGLAPELQAGLQRWRRRGLAMRHWQVGQGKPRSTEATLPPDGAVDAKALGGAEVAGADRHIADPTGRVWARYGVERAGAAYLLRPDQHVAARWLMLDVYRLDAALSRALARA